MVLFLVRSLYKKSLLRMVVFNRPGKLLVIWYEGYYRFRVASLYCAQDNDEVSIHCEYCLKHKDPSLSSSPLLPIVTNSTASVLPRVLFHQCVQDKNSGVIAFLC